MNDVALLIDGKSLPRRKAAFSIASIPSSGAPVTQRRSGRNRAT